jgi:hypothetical protein
MRTAQADRVLVIGADGGLGELVADAFWDGGWRVRRGVRRPTSEGVFVDLDQPDTIAEAVFENELVVNTVPHSGLAAERWILEHGGRLINVSALPAAAGRSLRATAGDARGTVLMNAGIAPGVTNLVAADLLAEHPETEELELVFTFSTSAPNGRRRAAFAHRGLPAVPRHRAAVVPLPEPFGERRCLGFGGDDDGWIGGLAEGRVIRTYVCVAELAGREPVAHWVAILRNRERLCARTVECDGEIVHAARATVVFAQEMLKPGLPLGCFYPEETLALCQIEARLGAAGIRIIPRTGQGSVDAVKPEALRQLRRR